MFRDLMTVIRHLRKKKTRRPFLFGADPFGFN